LKKPKTTDLVDRRTAAADARKDLVNAYRAAQVADMPARVAKREERAAIASAREMRRLQRERLKVEERHRLATEEVDRQTAADAAALADADRIAKVVNDEAERKAERDRRYANRKARRA